MLKPLHLYSLQKRLLKYLRVQKKVLHFYVRTYIIHKKYMYVHMYIKT